MRKHEVVISAFERLLARMDNDPAEYFEVHLRDTIRELKQLDQDAEALDNQNQKT